ncbi:MAG: hypothetical protein E5V95_01120 [Mesorhizobium sp.]|nr:MULTISPECIES: hypothetical protein [unclassified Mesorhizobium]RUW42190.1 hypothetical protein EOA37_06465 [Mesorhizobium sp. M2A.F.Ca.ET.015.02.1.1]RWA92948.1 MAG: hypothetical protein EOQ31_04390 [Mesorhizobium sp.]RWB49486.1 MAG: hypothetical protein EOQ46_04205 [Mesorhizobium sp.]RWD76926.1 MAG: hypothetical protein EOS60_01825 [Mesorhizobium sp.]RWE80864.1 MAG: hypothetical protein EOS63_11190 [Mesorhizobium sp.]
MARYRVDELFGEDVVSTNEADADNALQAVEDVTGKVISPRALQEHWFRVTDESGTIHEFSVDADPAKVFSK